MRMMKDTQSMRRHAHGGRGFATMMVIASMIFLAAAIVGLSTLFAHEARRTRAAVAETQLRQLLQAGVPAAQAELAANGNSARDVPMVVPVDGAKMQLHIVGAQTDAEVSVAGTYRGFRASQRVRFTRVAGGWVVSDTRLEQTGQQ
jgi:Tfp pilus assembly protein PilV